MAYDFPSSPTDGQRFSPITGPTWIYNAARGAWKKNAGTALPANLLVNPAMQISQQYGDNPAPASSLYVLDQWTCNMAGTQTIQRVAAATPSGSKYRLRATIIATSTQDLFFEQNIEGNRIVPLNYGTAGALQSILRFGAKGPAGTYCVAIRGYFNSASIIFPFTLPNQVDTVLTFVVPPSITTTWANDTGIGARVMITGSTGTGQSSTPNVWTATSNATLVGGTNNMATTGAVFEIFDVGWYPDPLNTGVAPEFQAPHIEDDLQDCLRYWYPGYRFDGVVNAATNGYGWLSHYVPMRISPTRTLVGTTFRCYDAGVAPNITSISNYNSHEGSGSLLFTAAAGGMTPGRPFMTLVDGQTANYIAVDARL